MAVKSSLKPNLDEARAENNFIAILCKNRGLEKFTDQSFTFDKALQGFETSWIRKTWARKEIESNQWCVFDKPKITDFRQVEVGNCWFISALALLVQNPHLINEII